MGATESDTPWGVGLIGGLLTELINNTLFGGAVMFNPTSHGVSDSVAPMGGGPQRPPLRNQGRSHF